MFQNKDAYYSKYHHEVAKIMLADEWIRELSNADYFEAKTVTIDILTLSSRMSLDFHWSDPAKFILEFLFSEPFRKKCLSDIKDPIIRNYFENVYDELVFGFGGIVYKAEFACLILPYVTTHLIMKELTEWGVPLKSAITYLKSHKRLSNWLDSFSCSLCPETEKCFIRERLRALV